MGDWIARAINPAKNHTQKDAAVAKDALRCNRWIASSALQKAVRRGDVALAERAAFALHREDRSATWRRLIAIAFEDVGPADLDVILETVALATLPKWRAVIGEEAALRSIVSTLATAPKDRSADYLMWIATEHPDLRQMREICGHSSITECLSMVLDHSRSLPDRAVAAWFCSGINYPYQHRVGAGDLAGLGDAYCRLGAPSDLVAATVLAAKRTRQPYAVLVPLIWLEVQCSGVSRIEDAIVPPSGLVDGIPLYALDEHTRLGKRAINTLAQQTPSIRACLQRYVPRRRWIAAAQHAAFYAEGSAVSRRLHWAQSRSLERLGIEAELSTAEVRPDGVEPLIGAIRESRDQLNALRTQLLLTVGANAG
jgi:MgsA AAA+ ATPase C terminal